MPEASKHSKPRRRKANGGRTYSATHEPNFRALFESAPESYLVLDPSFTIVGASDEFLRTRLVARESIVGRALFEVFPDDPGDPQPTGMRNLRASLDRVLAAKAPDTMAVQKYPIRVPASEGGGFTVRYYSPVNVPVFGDDGNIIYIIHRSEDVTEFVRLKLHGAEQSRMVEEQRSRADKMEEEVYLRAQEIQRANETLRTLDELKTRRFSNVNQTTSSARSCAARIAGAPRVLLAEDNADMRAYICRVLLPQYEVETVADGIEALAAIRARIPDLVISDIKMPGIDGLTLLRTLREDPQTQTVPVMLLTALAGEMSRVEGATCGADDYLAKPFSPRELLARVAARIELTRLRQEITREAQRKDEFLAMLAHELRNPLAPIRLALHLIRAQQDQAPAERLLEILEHQTDNLTRIVDDLLDISRLTRGKIDLRREQLDIASVVSRALDATQGLFDSRHQTISVKLPDEPVHVFADPVRLEQILINLLTNAAKYTQLGGSARVYVEAIGEQVELRVRDNGAGIAPHMLDRIWHIFEQGERTLDRSQGGLGIGLSIVRELVELHGGTVEAQSPGLGKGSTFVVRLPIIKNGDVLSDELAHVTGDDVQVSRSPSRKLRVLIVDDNVEAAMTFGDLVRQHGHEVRIAHDGLAALAVASEQRPDIVFLDIGLPGMDGYEVARRLRASNHRPAKLVAVSGYGQAANQYGAREAGFTHYLVKPAQPVAVLGILEETVAQQGAGEKAA